MKDVAFSMWKWTAVGLLVGAVGGMLLFGIGRRRGTRTYRWRLALWTLALSLPGGTVMVTAGCAGVSEKKAEKKPDLQSQDLQVMCYEQVDVPSFYDTGSQDLPTLCYKSADIQPSPDIPSPDTAIMCYDPMPPDIIPDPLPDVVEPDDLIMCYKQLPDAIAEPPEVIHLDDDLLMCYFAGDFPTDTES